MRRAILLALTMLAAAPLSAQHGGGCACGKNQALPTAWEIELPAGSAWYVAVTTELAKWNEHAGVVQGTALGNGTWGRFNGKNEIVFLTAAEIEAQYGIPMDSDDVGVTWISPVESFGAFDACPIPANVTCGTFNETDVIINRDYLRGWTTTGPPDFDDDQGPLYFGATVLHEVGHALGLHHNFQNLSTMNYMEDYAAWYLALADTSTLRAHYPQQSKLSGGMAAYPFRHDGGTKSGAAKITSIDPPSARGGDVMTVKDFSLENIGSGPNTNVTFSIALSTNDIITSADYTLGFLSWPTFQGSSFWDATAWGFRVPEGIPSGTYYVGGRVSDYPPFQYNDTWMLDASRRVTITNAGSPIVGIKSPAPGLNGAPYETAQSPLVFSGTATSVMTQPGDKCDISFVTCHVETEPSSSPMFSGIVSGTTNWSCTQNLTPGLNHFTVRAVCGRFTGAATMTVSYIPACTYWYQSSTTSAPYYGLNNWHFWVNGYPSPCKGSWSFTNDAPWLTLQGPTGGNGPVSAGIRMDAPQNFGPERVANIRFSWGETLTIRQDAAPPPRIFPQDGSYQKTPVNTAFAPMTAMVYSGNLSYPGATVTWSVIPGAGGGSGTFQGPATVTADANGIATAPVLLANGIVDSFTVTASVQGAEEPAVYALTNTGGHIVPGAPYGVSAVATGPNTVIITWVMDGPQTAWEVSRTTDGVTYPVSFNVTTAAVFHDTTAAPNTAYLYRVRALAPHGSAYSLPDLATTVRYSDRALFEQVTLIRATQITELRTAVNAVRRLAALPAYAFTNASLAAGMTIEAAHVLELRTALTAARTKLILPALIYARPLTPRVTTMSTIDINELREGVR